jgi:DUF1680 family protein
VQRRMYITGGLGAVAGHEGFGPDYVLPNNGYLETCAAVGAGFFHHNMALAFADAHYVDELERVLYNGILCGVSLEGDRHYYQNPLEGGRERARWAWHDCPCCPPMFLKITGALPSYIYAHDADSIYVNLFIGSQARIQLGANRVTVTQTTRYPWEGQVHIAVALEQPAEFDLYVRVPAWCRETALSEGLYTSTSILLRFAVEWRINDEMIEEPEIVRGYAHLRRAWCDGDVLALSLPMLVRRVRANPSVEADRGRAALMRGPLVYCLESLDTSGQVQNLYLTPEGELSAEHQADLLGGVTVIRGIAENADGQSTGSRSVPFSVIPYYANTNRGPSEMLVWLPCVRTQMEPVDQGQD